MLYYTITYHTIPYNTIMYYTILYYTINYPEIGYPELCQLIEQYRLDPNKALGQIMKTAVALQIAFRAV